VVPVVILIVAIIMVVYVLTHDRGIPADLTRSLRRVLKRLIENPLLAVRLGAVAWGRVPERLSLARYVDDRVRLWSDMTGNGRQ